MTPKAIDRTGIFVGRQSLIPFIFCLFLVACTPKITRKEYDQKCKEAVKFQNPLTGQVYYQGSKDGFDYFLLTEGNEAGGTWTGLKRPVGAHLVGEQLDQLLRASNPSAFVFFVAFC